MTELYSTDTIRNKKKEIRRSWMISLLCLFLAPGASITLACFLSDERFKLFVSLMVIFSSIGGVIFLYFLFTSLIPSYKLIAFIRKIDFDHLTVIEGVIFSVSKPVTIASYVTVVEVDVLADEKHQIIYLDTSQKERIKIGQKIRAELDSYQVIRYETAN